MRWFEVDLGIAYPGRGGNPRGWADMTSSEILGDISKWKEHYRESFGVHPDIYTAPVALPALDASWPEAVREHTEALMRRHASATEKRLRGPDPSLVVFDEVDWETVERVANAFDVPTELLMGES